MNLILFEPHEIGRPLPAADARTRHLLSVLRARKGDRFAAGILNGPKGLMEILSAAAEGISFLFIPAEDPRPLFPLELIIGVPRPLVTGRLLKDLTSLGVRALRFVRAELCEKSYLSGSLWKNEAYRRHLREGLEQSGNTLPPEVSLYPRLKNCLDALPPQTGRYVLDPARGAARLGETEPPPQAAVLAVGPERGWTPGELERFVSAGFQVVRMGERILRTEAAALAASAILLSRMGFM
jgi:RsmE family RNA methyltransferase